MLKKILAIITTTFLVAPLATAQELPEGYGNWLVVFDQQCDDLRIELRRTVTLDGEQEAMPIWWEDELVNVSLLSDSEDGETSSTAGLYGGQWTTVDVVDKATEARSQRLIEASIIQAGGQEAYDAFVACKEEIGAQIMDELRAITEGIHEAIQGFGEALSEGLSGME